MQKKIAETEVFLIQQPHNSDIIQMQLNQNYIELENLESAVDYAESKIKSLTQ